MIPLIVCRTYSPQEFLTASGLAATAIVVGGMVARQRSPYWAWIGGLISLYLPVAVLYGKWPFDPTWRYDCGFTPDPSIPTIYAALLFPLVVGAAYLISKRLRLFHR